MLRLYMRHVATGITQEVGEANPKSIAVDMRDAMMVLIDKVSVERRMTVVEAMSNSQVEIIAKWEPNNGG